MTNSVHFYHKLDLKFSNCSSQGVQMPCKYINEQQIEKVLQTQKKDHCTKTFAIEGNREHQSAKMLQTQTCQKFILDCDDKILNMYLKKNAAVSKINCRLRKTAI